MEVSWFISNVANILRSDLLKQKAFTKAYLPLFDYNIDKNCVSLYAVK